MPMTATPIANGCNTNGNGSSSHEVEVLRRRLAEQQALLQERDSRIQFLEQRHANGSPRQRQRSLSSSRNGNSSNSSSSRLGFIIIATMVAMVYFVGRQQLQTILGMNDFSNVSSSRRFGQQQLQVASSYRFQPSQQEYSHDSTVITNVRANSKPQITPFQSKPPQTIPLFDTDRPEIRRRHECIQRIRDRHETLLGPHLFPQQQQQQSSILLIDPAYHKNVGDHMITLGELTFFDRHQQQQSSAPATAISQCGYIQHGGFVPSCATYLANQSSSSSKSSPRVAAWHGGGNWGDLWPIGARIPSIGTLLGKGYSVVGMPQSLFYKDATVRDKDKVKLQHVVETGVAGAVDAKERVVLTWRELESYNQAKSLYPFVMNLLVPDIAFQLGPYRPLPTAQGKAMKLDILLFMRDDLESSLASVRSNAAVRAMLSDIDGGDGLRFQIVDWKDRLDIFKADDFFFTETSVQLLSLGRVVICDRLHAAILCYLSGIPFVYIDQMTGKISKTLGVALDGCADADSSLIARAHMLPEALQLAIGLLAKIP